MSDTTQTSAKRIPIIPHRYDSTMLIEILRVITRNVVNSENLPYLLHLNEGSKKRLLKGNREQPYWISPDKWLSNALADTQENNPDYNKLRRLILENQSKRFNDFISKRNLNEFTAYFLSNAYLHPTSFNDLFALMIVFCIKSYTPHPEKYCGEKERLDHLKKEVVQCALDHGIEQSTIDQLKAIDFSDSTKAAQKLLYLVPEARKDRKITRTAAPAQKKAELYPPLLTEYCELYNRVYPYNAPRNQNSLHNCILAADELLEFIARNQWTLCHDLIPLLPKNSRHYAPIEKCVCTEDPDEKPLLYAEHMARRLSLYHQYARKFAFRDRELFSRLLAKALGDAFEIQRIAFARRTGELALVRLTAPKDDPRLSDRTALFSDRLLAQSFLAIIEHYCLTAEHFGPEDPDTLISQYMSLAINALCSAACCCCKNSVEYRQAYERIEAVFIEASSPALSRLKLPIVQALAKYPKYTEQLRRIHGAKDAQVLIDSVVPPRSRLEDYHLFTPVFSGTYDSKAGRSDDHLEDIQRLTFELIASGRVPLLQLPQLCDNRCMLKLMLNFSGFDRLCSEGLIALSSYGDLLKPSDYVLRALSNPSFRFSCSDYLESEDARLRQSCRSALADLLRQDTSFSASFGASIPSEARIEIQFLANALRKIDSVFSQEHIRRYHQSAPQRTVPHSWANRPILPLPDVIENRIAELELDDLDHEIRGRAALLDHFRAMQKRMRTSGCVTRSDYELAIAQCMRERAFPMEAIRSFRRLTDHCYFLSNGRRSCDTVYTVYTDGEDDMLRLHSRLAPEGFRLDPNAATVKYVFEEFRSDTLSSRTVLSGHDMAALSQEIRSIMREQRNSPDKAAVLLEQNLNLGYIPTPFGRPIISSFNVRTAENTVFSISTTPDQSALAKGIEINE